MNKRRRLEKIIDTYGLTDDDIEELWRVWQQDSSDIEEHIGRQTARPPNKFLQNEVFYP